MATGDILSWNATESRWEAGPPVESGVTTLAALEDVTLPEPVTEGAALRYEGGVWVAPPAIVAELVPGAAVGQQGVLVGGRDAHARATALSGAGVVDATVLGRGAFMSNPLGLQDVTAIGREAAAEGARGLSVAVGAAAAATDQGERSVAVGAQAGSLSLGTGSVAIGYQAGLTTQPAATIAIGEAASVTGNAGLGLTVRPAALASGAPLLDPAAVNPVLLTTVNGTPQPQHIPLQMWPLPRWGRVAGAPAMVLVGAAPAVPVSWSTVSVDEVGGQLAADILTTPSTIQLRALGVWEITGSLRCGLVAGTNNNQALRATIVVGGVNQGESDVTPHDLATSNTTCTRLVEVTSIPTPCELHASSVDTNNLTLDPSGCQLTVRFLGSSV